MAEETKTPASQPATANQQPATAPPARIPKKGDVVKLVTGWREKIDAEVVDSSRAKHGLLDLVAVHKKSNPVHPHEVAVEKAPHDPTGTKPDSWHFAE